MASEVKVPELGENISGGGVLDIKVKEGDTVEKGQILLELEAEKSTMEVGSPMAGKLAKLLVKKGDQIKIGQPYCLIEAGDGAKNDTPKPAAPKPAAAPAAEATRPAAPKAEAPKPETQKLPPTAPQAHLQQAPPSSPAAEAPSSDRPVPAGPATRLLARELGVDLRRVGGSAKGGRVTQEDVKAFVRQLTSTPATAGGGGIVAPALPEFERWGPVERRQLDGIRRKTAEQMSLAWSLIPHVTQHDLADITDLDAFRRSSEGKGPKLTVTAFALKAVAIALKQMPQFNASLDLGNNQLVVKNYYHVGVAVDTERGLLVPVLRDVDKKSVTQLAQELTTIAEKARDKKISLDEMRGGTFTITNLGGIGGTAFTPIVNWPEVAILGMSRARQEPVVRDGQIVPRLMLPLSLSYDHRVIDGANAARFTRRIAEMLENPLLMLLHA